MSDTTQSLRDLLEEYDEPSPSPATRESDSSQPDSPVRDSPKQGLRYLLEPYENEGADAPTMMGHGTIRPLTTSEQVRWMFADLFVGATEVFTPRNIDPVQRYAEVNRALAVPEGSEVVKTFGHNLARAALDIDAVALKMMGIASSKLAELMGVPESDARDMITFKIGQSISDAARLKFPGDPKLQHNFFLTVAPQNIVNAVVFIAILAATRSWPVSADAAAAMEAAGLASKIKMLEIAGKATAGTLGGSLEAVSEYDAAIADGKSPQEAATIALLNVPLGVLDTLPVDMALKSIIKGDKGFKAVLRTFIADVATEAAQKVGSNIVAGRSDITEGVGTEALGTIFGPGGVQMSVAGASAIADRHRNDKPMSVLEESAEGADKQEAPVPKDSFDRLPDAEVSEDDSAAEVKEEKVLDQPIRGDTADVLQDEITEEADTAKSEDGNINTQEAGEVQTEISFSEISDSLPDGLDQNSDVETMRTAAADAGADGRHADRYRIGVAAMEQNGEIIGDIVTLDGGLLEDGDTFTIGSLQGRVKRRDGNKITIELSDGRATDTFKLDISDDIFANEGTFVRNRPSIINKLRRFIRKGIRDRRRERSQDRKQFREDIKELKRLHREDSTRLRAAGRDQERTKRRLLVAMIKRIHMAINRSIEKKDQGRFYKSIENLVSKKNPTERQVQKILSAITALHEQTAIKNARSEAKSLFSKMGKAKTLIGPFRRAYKKLGKPSFETMTLDESNVLYDQLQRIRAGNRLSRRVISQGKSVDRKAFEAKVVGELASEGLVLELDKYDTDGAGRSLASDKDIALLGKFQNVMVGVMENIGLDTLLEHVAGVGSALHRIAYDDIRKGVSKARAGTQQAADFMNQQLARAGLDPESPEMWSLSSAYSETVSGIQWLLSRGQSKIGATKATLRTFTNSAGEARDYTGAELMDLYNAIKDDDFLLRLLSGAKYRPSSHVENSGIVLSENDLVRLKEDDSILSANEKKVADSLFDYVNNILGPKYGEWSEQQNGYDNRVAHMYWMISRGGDVSENLDSALSNLKERLMQQASVAKGRKGDLKRELIGGDIFLRFHNHAHVISYLTEVQPAIQQARQLVNTGSIKKVLMGSPLGKRLHERLMANYHQLAVDAIGGAVKRGKFASGLRTIISNLASMLAYNPPVMLYQHASIFTAVDVIEGSYLYEAETGLAAFDTSLDAEMQSDPDLRDRMETNTTNLIIEGAAMGSPSLGGKKTAMQRGMAGIRAIDQTVIRVLWAASKLAGEAHGLQGESLRAFQAELTNKAIRRTQPTSNTIDASSLGIEARADTAAMVVNMFRSSRSKVVSVTLSRILQILAKKGSLSDHLTVLAAATLGPAVSVATVRMVFNAPFRDDDGDDDEDGLAVEFASEVISNVLGNFTLGDYAATLVRHAIGTRSFNPSNPIDSVLDTGLYAVEDIMIQEDDEGLSDAAVNIMRAAEALTALFGRPYSWPVGFVRKVYESRIDDDEF